MCSVVAVFTVSIVLQQVAIMQSQQAYEEYEQELENQQKLKLFQQEALKESRKGLCYHVFAWYEDAELCMAVGVTEAIETVCNHANYDQCKYGFLARQYDFNP